MEALRDLSSPLALELREGPALLVAGHHVVHGDPLILSEGKRVSADTILITAENLRVDESLLTDIAVQLNLSVKTAGTHKGEPDAQDRPAKQSELIHHALRHGLADQM